MEDTGKRCGKCSYNLTGLTVPRCPECGTTVTESPPAYKRTFVTNQLLGGLRVCCLFGALFTFLVIRLLVARDSGGFIVMLPSDHGFAIAIFVLLQIPCTAIGGVVGWTDWKKSGGDPAFRIWLQILVVLFLASLSLVVFRLLF